MKSRILLVILAVVLLVPAAAFLAAGCGGSSGVSQEDHDKIQMGMTMDEVATILGQPERSHVTGASQESIFWYFTKSDGEGLMKVAFEQGKVTSIAPYDESFNVGE